ncbi:hypothetical protein [Actinocrispum wychmicini]|uniref:Glycine rich protein n=1 Tax=Actinocrispum wychmicini TaxID=1213861 RepID=A0A4V2S6G2_9PSEU|nr:hypothetical protein [Actinocrispum wychmicini]TCO55940.1 hypothetical protein EV192_107363 [Actinocrispum wychmicini]
MSTRHLGSRIAAVTVLVGGVVCATSGVAQAQSNPEEFYPGHHTFTVPAGVHTLHVDLTGGGGGGGGESLWLDPTFGASGTPGGGGGAGAHVICQLPVTPGATYTVVVGGGGGGAGDSDFGSGLAGSGPDGGAGGAAFGGGDRDGGNGGPQGGGGGGGAGIGFGFAGLGGLGGGGLGGGLGGEFGVSNTASGGGGGGGGGASSFGTLLTGARAAGGQGGQGGGTPFPPDGTGSALPGLGGVITTCIGLNANTVAATPGGAGNGTQGGLNPATGAGAGGDAGIPDIPVDPDDDGVVFGHTGGDGHVTISW